MHCTAAFYGPIMPPNTGFITIPLNEKRSPNFRCTATGYTTGVDASTTIVKKLKLTGVPEKIQKTTCFIKGMFNSDVEAAKFVGAKVKAVSGIRGIIKKVLKGKNGIVRCSFEDKLLVSDIVFLRSWKAVDPPRYCENVLNLLNPAWQGMRPMGQLRRDYNQPLKQEPDSEYKAVSKRRSLDKAEPTAVVVSRTLRTALPFDMKDDFVAFAKPSGFEDRVRAATTVVPEPKELKKRALLDSFRAKEDGMQVQKREMRARNRVKASRDHQKDLLEQDRKIKKAKKETARTAEFKSQRKSR
jgi:ribosome biogenesis protein BMS1